MALLLASAHAKIGKIEPARAACRKAVDLLLATADDATNVEQRRVRVLAFGEIAEAYFVLAGNTRAPREMTTEHWRAARDMYQRSLEIMKDLRDKGILDAEEIPEIENMSRKIAECDTALEKKQ